ncbi:MAG: carboxypeptidase-like regulatory domain-containing protein [Treponema sp.]|nr:carboxypeptidase-like regulatory domain-containing protein [Treponema sp.]
MKKKLSKFFLCFIICYMLPCVSLYARGKQEEPEIIPLNNEWLLCITAFDYSGLSPSRRVAGEVIVRNLLDTLNTVSYRLRISNEYAYYEGYAWRQSLMSAAKSLSQKYDERSALIYRGEPGWKLKTSLKRIDADIVRLRESYEIIENNKPLIENEPVFGLSQANTGNTFPEAPRKGGERRFCQTQGADGFLTGQVIEFHGRYFIKIQLYILYTNSYVYEDDIIFSLEDTDDAVKEISARLTAVLSGNKPAAIAVNADPPEAQVLLNRNYAGRGTVAAREHPPGRITIAVSAEGYTPQTIETELAPGQLTQVDVLLSPLQYSNAEIIISNFSGVYIYSGALFVGEAPLTLQLPLDNIEYIYAVSSGGEEAKAVFTTPDMPGETTAITLSLKVPPPSGQQRVNKARNRYYWSWGSTWITIIAAWITNGISKGYSNALMSGYSDDLYRKANVFRVVSLSSMIVFGSVAAFNFYQMLRYLVIANKGATPIVKQEKKKL